MRRLLIVAPLAALLLTGCVVMPAGPGPGFVVAPPLPLILELGVEPFYFQHGYHYYYNNNRWSYSNSRSGPWADLPRSHYPREVRPRGGDDGRGRGPDRDGRRRD
ncbi:MAG: hypothetical protein IPI73_23005 [Betaproteobacteria bacterium]|nr:hypothetical protein [Betaproteobacteria bacterium]